MAIVLSNCGDDHGLASAKMTCLSARIWFALDIFLLIVIIYQIVLRVRRTHKKFSRKLLILYLLLIQPLINGIYSSVEYYIELYLLDIYFRHLCFVYIVYFFSRRAWLIGDNPTVFTKNCNKVVAIILFVYFTAVTTFGLANQDSSKLHCKDKYWIFLRMGGIFMTLLFMIEGVLLWKRYKNRLSQMIREFVENLKLYSQENGQLENACPAKDYIDEFNRTVIRTDEQVYILWEIIGFNFFSQFISLFSYIYYLANSSEPVNCRLYPESYKQHSLEANVIEMVLGTIIKIICFLLPILMPLKAFWISYKQPKIHNESKISQLDNLNINDDSFVSHEDDKNFWNSLKFKSKATEKSSNDDWMLATSNNGNNNNNGKEEEDINNKNNCNNNKNGKKSNTNVSRSSETEEEEKSPIGMISMLNANLQKTLKKGKVTFSEQN